MSGWYVSVERLNALENGKVTDGKIDYISYYIMLSTVHASDTQNSIWQCPQLRKFYLQSVQSLEIFLMRKSGQNQWDPSHKIEPTTNLQK